MANTVERTETQTMSRSKSPQTAAKRQEREAKKNMEEGKERTQSRIMLIVAVILMTASTLSYYIFYALPRIMRQRDKPHHIQGKQSNLPTLQKQTNHVSPQK